MTATPVYLNAAGVFCALGADMEAVATALWREASPTSGEITERFSPGRRLHVGVAPMPEPLPASVPLPLRSHNNAMLSAVLAQIRPHVDAAIARHGTERLAVVLGTSTSGIGEGTRGVRERAASTAWPVDYHYAQQELGSPARFVAEATGAQGPAYTVSTACSSGAKAVISGARLLRAGLADVVIAGGVDALCPFTVAGFSALEAISPIRSNPFSVNRNGINLGEGGALFVLSCEPGPVRLSGWGESSDAHHISAPDPAGLGASAAMREALARSGLGPAEIDYVNLHGTGTLQNDAMEALAMRDVLGAGVRASSTKPLTGHALGAAGAIEAALLWLTLVDNDEGRLPPHWWDGEADPALPVVRLVLPGERLGRAPRHALSHSFAFGGSNCALLLSAAKA